MNNEQCTLRRCIRSQEDLVHEAVGCEHMWNTRQSARETAAECAEVLGSERSRAQICVQLQLRLVVQTLHHEHLTCIQQWLIMLNKR